MNIGQYASAETHLKTLTTISTAKASDFHKLASVLKINKKYEEAIEVYKKVVQLDPNDDLARKYADNPQFAYPILRDSAIYSVVPAAINSPQSDFAPGFLSENKIIFSSSRGEGAGANKLYNWTQQPYLNVYTANITDYRLSEATVLSNDVNSKYHEGSMAFDPTTSTMYLTKNNVVRGNVTKSRGGRLFLGIYTATYNTDGTFGPMTKFPYNNKEWSVGHPSITKSGNRIYFVSDKPGGLGGTDIYYCDKDSGKWGEPKNIGAPINTPGDEMFPYALGDSILYFTSDGHVGLGGLDVYTTNVFATNSDPVNIGYPANSHFDDFAAIFFPDEVHGFISSNRPGGKGDDDIYEFSIHPPDFINVSGLVVDAKTGDSITQALVSVTNNDGSVLQALTDVSGKYTMRIPYKPVIELNGEKNEYEPGSATLTTKSRGLDYTAPNIVLKKIDFVASGKVLYDIDGSPAVGALVRLFNDKGATIDSTYATADGSYKLNLETNKKYKLEASKPDYVLLTKEIATTPGTSKVVVNDFRLFKLEKGTVVRLDNIYYDYGKATIRNDAKLELNKLVQILRDNATMKIELSSHTDARGSDGYNLKLSDGRAKSAVEYLISQGIDSSRLIAKGYGETKLLNKCGNDVKCSEEEHQFNRRTEFTILDI
jgi:outer membrane protein OmpA-like peptidoglycan-associated protein